jgi:hypothetical protein
MRPIELVIKAVLNVVPEECSLKIHAEKGLKSILRSSEYAAPEAISFWWQRAGEICGDCFSPRIGAKETEWQETARKIFNGEYDYKKYL